MTTKEKVINESIFRIEQRLAEIEKINNANHIQSIINIREDAQQLLETNTTIQQRTSKAFVEQIEFLLKKEKHFIKLAKEMTGQKMIDLAKERVKLEIELIELKNEKYHIERKK